MVRTGPHPGIVDPTGRVYVGVMSSIDRLRALHPDQTVHKVLVEERPALAAEQQVRTAPTVLEVDAAGTVVRSIAGAEPVLAYVSELAAV